MKKWRRKYRAIYALNIGKIKKSNREIKEWEAKNNYFNSSIERILRKEKGITNVLDEIVKLAVRLDKYSNQIRTEAGKVEKKFNYERLNLRLVSND